MYHDETPHLSEGICIDNIIQEIDALHNEITELKSSSYNDGTLFDVDTYLGRKKTWFAIVKYFERCWKIICSEAKTNLEKMYLIIIVPNKWIAGPNTIEELMVLLLAKSGVTFPRMADNYHERLHLVSRLEASISRLQVDKTIQEKLPSFIQNENRCMLYDLHNDGTSVKFMALYFQIKEDYNLKLLDERHYTLKYESRTDIYLFNSRVIDSIIHDLKQFIFKLLKVEDSITTSACKEYQCRTIGDSILKGVLALLNGKAST